MIKRITSITIFSTGEGKRIAGTYSEISESGDMQKQNEKVNFIALDEELLAHIQAIEHAAQAKIEGE